MELFEFRDLQDNMAQVKLGREFHGAFEGCFGGCVGATSIYAARQIVDGRSPVSVDLRFLKPLPAGVCQTHVVVLSQGRSLTTVSVDTYDATERLCARATVGFADVSALHVIETSGPLRPDFSDRDLGRPWKAPGGVSIPIIETLDPRFVGSGDFGIALSIEVPWSNPDLGAEGSCLPADMCVGPPVARANPDKWVPHPNPDLSLRFLPGSVGSELIGVGRLERVSSGLAMVGVSVWSGQDLIATGICSSMLLGTAK